jgi:hypothetical protein
MKNQAIPARPATMIEPTIAAPLPAIVEAAVVKSDMAVVPVEISIGVATANAGSAAKKDAGRETRVATLRVFSVFILKYSLSYWAVMYWTTYRIRVITNPNPARRMPAEIPQ